MSHQWHPGYHRCATRGPRPRVPGKVPSWAAATSSPANYQPGRASGASGNIPAWAHPGKPLPEGGSRVRWAWALPGGRLAGTGGSRAHAPASSVGPSRQINSATRASGGRGVRGPTGTRSKAHGSLNEPTDGALPVRSSEQWLSILL